MGKSNTYKSILIAPLDWGLGHATRCIPIIRYFLQKDWKVYIACPPASAHEALLKKEFPEVTFVPLFGYEVQYARSRAFFMPKMFLQLPRISQKIRKENSWLKKFVNTHSIDLIFSDNRYGLYHPKVPCVFMTHQLELILPKKYQQRIAQKISYHYIQKYKQCWIPDFKDNGLAGSLSHPMALPKVPIFYLGCLSRLGAKIQNLPIQYRYLIILSGPEPQRSILEEKFLKILPYLEGKILLVRGKPNEENTITVPVHCTIVNHLDNEQMRIAFASAEYIVSRTGYTTVMEILSWQKKSILIPTPGQTEQEYLGKQLHESHYAYCFSQETADYLSEFKTVDNWKYIFPNYTDHYSEKIDEALLQLGLL